MGVIPGFLPSTRALHYSNNTWPSAPDVQLATPFGPINIGNSAAGLCGGMAFATADLWAANTVPPATAVNPAPGSAAFKFVVARLIDSFHLPAGVAEYYLWMNLPTHDRWIGPWGTSHRTISTTMPAIRASIDGGHPCPLGLVTVHSSAPADLGKNHQVLAYGYDDSATSTTVHIYDPNMPDDDSVTLSFDDTNPTQTTAFVHSGGETVLGFFVVPYTTRDPAPLFA